MVMYSSTIRWGLQRVAGLASMGVLAAAIGVADTFAEFALLPPAKDSTLIEDPAGALANGSGPGIFSGRTASASRSIRRALLAFDIAAAVPQGSTITGAKLHLNLSATSAGPATVRLQRVLADWGEGTSSSGGGGGAPSVQGDSTWIHRFYDALFWSQPGGDFDPLPRGEAVVDQSGPYAWGSTSGMVEDVQSWLDDPSGNFGWILLGDETISQTVKRFDSRESPEVAIRPFLEVEYIPLCKPDPVGLGYWRQECAALANSGADVAGRAEPPAGTGDTFGGWILPCADRVLGDLGLPGMNACVALLSDPPPNCEDRAATRLGVLVMNVCAGRLQTSCPVDSDERTCVSVIVGDLLREVASLIRLGQCREAAACAAEAM
jgi:hypothetical protein